MKKSKAWTGTKETLIIKRKTQTATMNRELPFCFLLLPHYTLPHSTPRRVVDIADSSAYGGGPSRGIVLSFDGCISGDPSRRTYPNQSENPFLAGPIHFSQKYMKALSLHVFNRSTTPRAVALGDDDYSRTSSQMQRRRTDR
jgi:hypothetical protein